MRFQRGQKAREINDPAERPEVQVVPSGETGGPGHRVVAETQQRLRCLPMARDVIPELDPPRYVPVGYWAWLGATLRRGRTVLKELICWIQ